MARKLLLADDSITIQKVVELILAEEGFEIKATNNGEEALALIPSFQPDVVLADIEMPKINGYQLCEKIKQDPFMRSIPVILLAGAFEPIDEELAKQVNADDFIIKPFESQELISKLNAALTVSAVLEGEKVEGVVEAEALGSEEAPLEEDLWAMEEIPEAAEVEGWPAEEGMEAGTEELLEVAEEAEVEAEAEAAVEETIPPVVEKPAAEVKVGIPKVELPSMDEFKDIFEKAVNEKTSSLFASLDIKDSLMPLMKDSIEEKLGGVSPDLVKGIFEKAANERISSLLVSLDIKEAVLGSLMPLMKDSTEKVLGEVAPDLVKDVFEKAANERISSLLVSLDIKEAVLGSLMPLMKDSVEKIIWEVAPDLLERMLKEMLKGSLESLTKEVEKVIWETVPDLAETMISKEIERIRSEF